MYLFKPFYGHKKDNATNGTYYIPYTYWYSLLKSINDFFAKRGVFYTNHCKNINQSDEIGRNLQYYTRIK